MQSSAPNRIAREDGADLISLLLEEFGDGNRESRQQFRGFYHVGDPQEAIGAGGLQHVDLLPFRVNDPDRVATSREVLLDFAHQLADGIGRRENLDSEIRRTFGEALSVKRL